MFLIENSAPRLNNLGQSYEFKAVSTVSKYIRSIRQRCFESHRSQGETKVMKKGYRSSAEETVLPWELWRAKCRGNPLRSRPGAASPALLDRAEQGTSRSHEFWQCQEVILCDLYLTLVVASQILEPPENHADKRRKVSVFSHEQGMISRKLLEESEI